MTIIKRDKKIKTSRIFLTMSILLSLLGCAGSGIRNVTVLRQAPPYEGPVEQRIYPDVPRTSALFQMAVGKGSTNVFGSLPSPSLMDEIRRKGASLGANILVYNCGAPGTVGQAVCIVTGYFEK